jgi:recombinational DNA repair protein (RecF pathway)
MTWTQIFAIVEALMQNPNLKPIEEAELNQLRTALAANPFLLMIVNALAATVGL